ncbi:MAG: DUF3160 domain-containing protein [Anaerolineae bacterium]|nr:DUF3160 domain-containing protein [Anaerolineae bacterium]
MRLACLRPAFTFIVLITALALLSSCASAPATPIPTPTTSPTDTPTTAPTTPPSPTDTPVPTATAPPTEPAPEQEAPRVSFASFYERPVQTTPAMQHEPIAPDLSNVTVPFVLSPAQRERLAADGFVVSPGTEKEFFTVYERARYDNQPIFVTSDSLLHVYHLLFDKVLRTAEVRYFIPLLRDLNAALLAQADAQYQALQHTSWEDAARRTVAFVAVGSRLLDPDVAVPDYAADLVQAEVSLVMDSAGILPSPLFPGLEYGEDYTQYIPRGHYTKFEELEAYFRSMMWYGRMTFRLETEDPEVGRAETRSALLLVRALRSAQVNGRPALDAWADLYDPTAFFVGRSDDLTVTQYIAVMDAVHGPDPSLEAVADDALLDRFIAEAGKLPPPRVLGMIIFETDDVEQQTKGMRLMGQRFVPDAYIIRQLIYRNVGTSTERRGLPKGLDIPAAMGSERAYQHLEQMGETSYLNYAEQMAKMRAWIAGLTVEEWTETLYNSWLYSFLPLLRPTVDEPGYPAFMRSLAWADKQLNTVLGSWAELKHDTILYAKQAYAELGAGPMPPEPVPPKGYVEPVPQFYARLAALTAMTREGLSQRGMLDERDGDSLQRLEELAVAFQTMAEKELRGEPLTEEEYRRIRFYGGELEHLTMAAADTEGEDGGRTYMEEQPQAAVIADVATDPWPVPRVLEVGVGRINVIYAVVPVVEDDGTLYLQVAKGGVFSYYEFPWPQDDRLTDEKWRAMLDEGQAPPLQEWMGSFMEEEGENSDLTSAIHAWHQALTSAYWHVYAEGAAYLAQGDALDQLRAALEPLQAEGHMVGHQLVSSGFRSFDRQADDLALVTVREVWQDELYQVGEYPGDAVGEPLAERGPYTLDVTYTLKRDEGAWKVIRAVYANEPPAW